MKQMFKALTIWMVSAAAILTPICVAAAQPGIAGHTATYKIRLARAAPAGQMQGMSGEMILEVKTLCEGLTVNQVLTTDFWEQDGIVRAGHLSASSWERGDGLSMRFSLANRIDGTLVEAFEGEAARDAAGTEGLIIYRDDLFPAAPLPAGAVFPAAHLKGLIEVAQAGGRVFQSQVFDGAGEGKVYQTTAIIGPKLTTPDTDPGAKALEGLERWPVVLSYFPIGSDDPLPEYETSFHLYANGVSGHLLMDYGDFALRGMLEKLEIAEAPVCD